jgi:endonuclease YncB( thermonuclease family)
MIAQMPRVAGLIVLSWLTATPAAADECGAPIQSTGQSTGHVASVSDGRTLRLADGGEIRLAGLAPFDSPDHAAVAHALLTQLVRGRDVTIEPASDTPDRYGRQVALIRLDDGGPSVQAMLAAQGGALADGSMDKACTDDMQAAEADARRGRLGIWARTAGNDVVIKNAESRGDILERLGRFAIVEGRVRSVRQVGAVTYINFGRRWTHDFVVTIQSKALARFTAAGLAPQSFEGQRLRSRGIVEQRGGSDASPRIEATRPGQIEIVASAAIAGASE